MSVKLTEDADELSENHEINVTPFIDVMLVLLIIFMVAAPFRRSTFRWICRWRRPSRNRVPISRFISASNPT